MITEKDKMEKLTHGSLFSGIGGFDLAAEWIGWENKFHCEWDDFGKKILSYYWPNAKSYGDITKTDFRQWRGGIDVLTGGFPCQPFSTAGKRLGKDDNRYLWPEMLRAIREIQPTWVIGENVGGIISMVQPCDEVKVGCQTSLLEEDYFTKKEQEYVVETVCSDLEREGYSVQPVLIPACSVGAPHRRDRIWFVAHSVNRGYRNNERENREKNGIQEQYRETVCSGVFNGTNYGITSNTFDQRLQGGKINRGTGEIGQERKQQLIRSLPSTWENFPTQPPVCCGHDGLSSRLAGITFSKHRNESIKAYGNAIVPQVAYEIFKAIKKIEVR